MSLFLELLALAGLIVANAFFVAGEYALVTARRTRIAELEQQGVRRARTVQALIRNPPRFIAAMQLGVTATSLAIGALGEPVLARVFDPVLASLISFILAFLIITFLHVVVGELVPKAAALGHAERIALMVAAPVRGFFVLLGPLIWVLQRSTELIVKVLGLEPEAGAGVHSEAEIRLLLSQSSEYGKIEHAEREMVYKVFDFADKEVSDVMVPRPEVVALSIDLPPEEALAAVLESPYTRYPVYRGSLDDVVGILHVRDLISALKDQGIAQVRLEDVLRQPYMVPETKDLAALLAEFRRQNQHLAIVVNEYGTMEGIATLEDLLEEIVGEIEDEFDLPDESVERVDDDTIRIDGTFPIDDFNEQFKCGLPIEDFHTMGGLVFGALGRAPEEGDELDVDGLHFRVVEVQGSRIDRLEVRFVGNGSAPEELETQGEPAGGAAER